MFLYTVNILMTLKMVRFNERCFMYESPPRLLAGWRPKFFKHLQTNSHATEIVNISFSASDTSGTYTQAADAMLVKQKKGECSERENGLPAIRVGG